MVVLEALNNFLFEGDLQEKYLIKYSAIPLGTIFFYILFVKWWGPILMKDKKPFDLKYTMIIYNFMQSICNAYIVYKLMLFVIKYWPHRCLSKQNPELPTAIMDVKRTAWLVFLLKYIDLIDTVFFVLRKKYNQVSFLHVFHHTVICLLSWWFIRELKEVGFYILFGLTINTAVHVVMYSYYGLAAFGPVMKKFLWWKRYLTQFQIAQFFVVMLYMLNGFITGCEELGTVEITTFLFILAICVLFFDFYRKDFSKKDKKTIPENVIASEMHKKKIQDLNCTKRTY